MLFFSLLGPEFMSVRGAEDLGASRGASDAALLTRAKDGQLFSWPVLILLIAQPGCVAGIVRALCEAIAKNCPKAWVAIISNPVNSTVPIAAEVFKRCTFGFKQTLLVWFALLFCRHGMTMAYLEYLAWRASHQLLSA